MDQTNYYYGKHNLGYQPVFANSGADYQPTAYSDHSLSHLHHMTALNLNSNGNSSGSNSTCSDLSNASAANLSRASGNGVNANSSVNEFNTVLQSPFSRRYPYIPDDTSQNVSSAPSNTTDCNNITYGSSFTSSKSYDQTTNSAHVPVIAVTSNSSHTRLAYASYQNIDYSLHKTINQSNYSPSALMPSPSSAQNRSTLNSSAVYGQNHVMEHIPQATGKQRSNASVEGKALAKTSVIKPLNPFNATGSVPAIPTPAPTPINYAKLVQSYPIYENNNKTASTIEKSPSTNRGMCLNSSTNHKSSDVVYCPEPIPARYPNPGYPLNVSTAGVNHTNSHFFTANSYPLNYGHHHMAQQQNSVSHARNLPTYQTSFNESVTNYYNRQNGLVVRPTPNTIKQNQSQYQNAYSYGRSGNIPNNASVPSVNHPSNSHATLPKPQSQKPTDESYNPLALDLNGSYDRRNLHQYTSMYGSNYMDPTGYDDYSQYSGFASANPNPVPFYPTKAPSKVLYSYTPGLNMYNSGTPHVHLSPQSSQSVTATSSSSTIQQPVPINPSSSQLISSNYDASPLHAHPMLSSPLFNNNSKDYCTSNQYQQNAYASQILYSRLQNGSYYQPMKSNQSANLPSNASDVTHSLQPKVVYAEKSLPPVAGFGAIDLEERINSSKIPKVSGPVVSHSISEQHRINDLGPKRSTMNVQETQRQRKSDSSQNTIGSNKNAYVYNNHNSYSDCYQSQWQKTVSSAPATTSSTTTHLHPKKQSLRDFLSTWNEFEEEDADAMNKKTSVNHHTQGEPLGSNNGIRFEKLHKAKENVPVIVPPLVAVQPQMHASHMQSSYPRAPIPNVPVIAPKMHVESAVDNLPDIIIDIEKTKVGGEGECFERTNGKEIHYYFVHYVIFSFYLWMFILISSHSRGTKSVRKTVHSGFN